MMRFSKVIAAGSVFAIAACTSTPAPTTPASEEGIKGPATARVTPMPSAMLDTTQTITRIAFGSCLKQEDDQSIWNSVARSEPDVFLFIGDNVYGDNYSGEPGLPELHEAYAKLAESKPFAAFRQETPLLVTWDDHDFGLNDNGASFQYREDAEALFEDVWAVPENSPVRARPGIYDSRMIGSEDGKRVQILMLDTRFFRSDLKETNERNAPGKERYLPDTDVTKTMLGNEQWLWLTQELRKPADLRIIASSIQVIADGHGWEAWRTLPKEREKLYATITATGAENVIFVSGDRHAGGIYRRNLVTTYPLYEVTSSSLNAPLSAWLDVTSPDFRQEAGPHRIGEMFYDENFGIVDIDWEQEVVSLRLTSKTGETVREQIIPLTELRPAY
ncbi:alkaline phosphatase D family protein [Parvularcula sp. IMCC14364]|uniref:alkaline phosphatase D family protein n=1 Tax=Parvularcula sp. IMCC14364 TaxID=3067902 RepID=UPI002741D0E1|nr:alkaline phosphatase D family protein [Parvularcula sp. IMCC14364]